LGGAPRRPAPPGNPPPLRGGGGGGAEVDTCPPDSVARRAAVRGLAASAMSRRRCLSRLDVERQ